MTDDRFAVTNPIAHDMDLEKTAFQAGVHRLLVQRPGTRDHALYQFRLAEGYALKALAQLRAFIADLDKPAPPVVVERQSVLPSGDTRQGSN